MESACQEIIRLAEKVMDGGQITPEEAGRLIRTKDEDTMLLLAMADKTRQPYRKYGCFRYLGQKYHRYPVRSTG